MYRLLASYILIENILRNSFLVHGNMSFNESTRCELSGSAQLPSAFAFIGGMTITIPRSTPDAIVRSTTESQFHLPFLKFDEAWNVMRSDMTLDKPSQDKRNTRKVTVLLLQNPYSLYFEKTTIKDHEVLEQEPMIKRDWHVAGFDEELFVVKRSTRFD